MSETTYTIKELMDWCDNQVAEGKQLSIHWEGGGDSGWVYFQVDEEDTSAPEADQLVDMMYEKLDYGSWAGEFSASGTAYYNAETKCFEGIDYYSETETDDCSADIKVVVPETIGFDSISIHYNGSGGDALETVDVTFNIRNGFQDPRAKEVAEKLEKELIKDIDDTIEKACKNKGQEYDGCWDDIEFNRNEFVKKGNNLELTITQLSYNYCNVDDKSVEINLAEMLKEEDTDEL